MRTITFYWLKNHEDLDRVKAALESLKEIPEIVDLFVGVPAETGDHLMDESYDVMVYIEYESEDGLKALLESPIHKAAGPIFMECLKNAQGYSVRV